MSQVLIISDTHFGHNNICKFRPEFETVEQHDITIYSNIMSMLRKNDTLWLLGDCFFTEDSYEYLRDFSVACSQVNMTIGNHDTDSNQKMRLLHENFHLFNKVGGLFKTSGAWLSHAPLHPAELRGKVNVHGHVHTASLPDKNYYNVSCENVRYFPVNLHQLLINPSEYLVDYGDPYGV